MCYPYLVLKSFHNALVELLKTPRALVGYLFKAALVVLGGDPLKEAEYIRRLRRCFLDRRCGR